MDWGATQGHPLGSRVQCRGEDSTGVPRGRGWGNPDPALLQTTTLPGSPLTPILRPPFTVLGDPEASKALTPFPTPTPFWPARNVGARVPWLLAGLGSRVAPAGVGCWRGRGR